MSVPKENMTVGALLKLYQAELLILEREREEVRKKDKAAIEAKEKGASNIARVEQELEQAREAFGKGDKAKNRALMVAKEEELKGLRKEQQRLERAVSHEVLETRLEAMRSEISVLEGRDPATIISGDESKKARSLFPNKFDGEWKKSQQGQEIGTDLDELRKNVGNVDRLRKLFEPKRELPRPPVGRGNPLDPKFKKMFDNDPPPPPPGKGPGKVLTPNQPKKTTITASAPEWDYFFHQGTSQIFATEKALNKHPVASIEGVSAESFRSHFRKIGERLINDPDRSDPMPRGYEVLDNPASTSYQIARKGDEQSVIQLAHIPATKAQHDQNPESGSARGKIDITLIDPELKDDSIYLMMIAVKNTLESLGRTNGVFNIENCENKPDIALKMYVIGKSLGLEPQFKDKPGMKDATLANIERAEVPVLKLNNSDDDSKIVKMGDVYRMVESGAVDAKEVIKELRQSPKPTTGLHPGVL